ncbi:hypothetical protein P8452_42399 [Trifolium repens]|nr:hypothetical protein P8452_42399 [Trifolium repens]
MTESWYVANGLIEFTWFIKTSPTTTSPEITYAAPELLSAAIVSYDFHLGMQMALNNILCRWPCEISTISFFYCNETFAS